MKEDNRANLQGINTFQDMDKETYVSQLCINLCIDHGTVDRGNVDHVWQFDIVSVCMQCRLVCFCLRWNIQNSTSGNCMNVGLCQINERICTITTTTTTRFTCFIIHIFYIKFMW